MISSNKMMVFMTFAFILECYYVIGCIKNMSFLFVLIDFRFFRQLCPPIQRTLFLFRETDFFFSFVEPINISLFCMQIDIYRKISSVRTNKKNCSIKCRIDSDRMFMSCHVNASESCWNGFADRTYWLSHQLEMTFFAQSLSFWCIFGMQSRLSADTHHPIDQSDVRTELSKPAELLNVLLGARFCRFIYDSI